MIYHSAGIVFLNIIDLSHKSLLVRATGRSCDGISCIQRVLSIFKYTQGKWHKVLKYSNTFCVKFANMTCTCTRTINAELKTKCGAIQWQFQQSTWQNVRATEAVHKRRLVPFRCKMISGILL